MTDGNTRKKAQAVFFSLVMVLSMVGGTVALAGSAAATVQDFDGVNADDVTAGTSGVVQEVTLQNIENDGDSATVTISNNLTALDDSVISGVSVTNANGHTVDGTPNIQSDGTIVVNLASSSSATADLVLDVTLDLSQLQDETVTYTASTNNIEQTDTFDISVAQPSFASGDATIPEANANTIEVAFDEPVQTDSGTIDSDVTDAFSLTGTNGAAVNGFQEIKGQNNNVVVLTLTDYVEANAGPITITYDGDSGAATNPIVHRDDSTVIAQDSTDDSVVSNAVPTIASATVTDSRPGEIDVTFTEPISGTDTTAINNAFSISDNRVSITGVAEDAATNNQDEVRLTLNTSVAPGADLTGLSYNGADGGGPLTATSNGDDVYDFQDQTVSNDVVPSIQSAEVTAANADEILVTYDGDVEAVDGVTVADSFDYDGTETVQSADFSPGDSTQLALKLGSSITAGQGSLSTLNYADSADSTAAATDAVQSVSGTTATNPDAGISVTNNVAPTFVSAKVVKGSPSQVEVTFSEAVVADVGSGNIDSAVTDAFEVKNSDVDYRVKNVESGLGTQTLVLNLGLEDGTTQEVNVGDDLTGALSYDPSAPSGDEKNPLVADGGTSAAAESFTDEDVTNNLQVNLDIAEVTTDGDELRVTFTNDVTQVGTDSEVVNEFTVSDSAIDLTDDSFAGIENGDTVVFSGYTKNGLTSGTDLSGDLSTNGNGALEVTATNEALPSFSNEDIQNNIQPRIVSAKVTNANRGEIEVTYTEDIAGSDTAAYEAFSLSGSDAPEIDGQSPSGSTLTLSLAEDVAQGDDLGTLTYNGGTDGQEVISALSTAVGVDGDSASVTNNVGTNPVLQNVTVDDVAENNGGSGGEMLLAFDRDVRVSDTSAVSGLSFESNLTDVGVSITSLSEPKSAETGPNTDVPGNIVIASFSSDSNSVSSSIQEEDNLSDASLTVDPAGSVGIVDDTGGNSDGNSIAETKTTDVSNEIAGNLATVESTEIDAELIGTEVDTKGDFTVTVTGFKDDSGTKVVDDTAKVNIGGVIYDVTPNRFGASATVKKSPTSISKGNVEIGSEVTVDVANAEAVSTQNVTYVHEAFTQNEGWALTSQPMPGEFVAGDNISDVTYYDADAAEDASDFASYDTEDQVQMVHNALFVNADSDNAEYGFAYDEDRSGQQTNVGDVNMGEGWHIVGSNYDISSSSITLDQDLATENAPESSAVDVQLKSLPGTTLNNGATVDDHAVYYVYLHQEDSRAIVLPAYSSTKDTGSSVTNVA